MLLQGNVDGFQHLAFFVTDIERSKKFYKEFGFVEKLVDEIPLDPEPVKLAFIDLNGFTLELVELPGEMRNQVAAREDGHIDHVALNVKDIDKAYAELTAAGFKVLEEDAPVFLPLWENGTKYFTIRGPDGEKIEISQIL
ncbi:MAG: VOC family protein [Anaerolineaceae bacterium]|nr:VOC family protein [Anaerolineaceae bacterium]